MIYFEKDRVILGHICCIIAGVIFGAWNVIAKAVLNQGKVSTSPHIFLKLPKFLSQFDPPIFLANLPSSFLSYRKFGLCPHFPWEQNGGQIRPTGVKRPNPTAWDR